MALKQIPVSLLRLGMYVTKLDVSWIDSPFITHHILLKSDKQLDKLRKADIKLVTIDTSKGKDVLVDDHSNSTPHEHSTEKASEDIKPPASCASTESDAPKPDTPKAVVQPCSLDAEMGAAKMLMSKMTTAIADMNESLKNGGEIQSALVEPFIEETLGSLKRNDQALATLINLQRKDQSLAKHTFATFGLALSLGIQLELSDNEKEQLGLAAFFHDAGWLKLPLNLLGKKSAYTPTEAKLVQQHIAIGKKTLTKQCDLSDDVLRIIEEHHECVNGSGYPKQIDVGLMHPLSKVFSVVVRYDELVHGLLDRPALTPNGALAVLFKEAKQGLLDTHIVSSLVSLLSVYPVGSYVQLSNKEKAKVIEIHPDKPKLPKVKVFYDVAGLAHVQAKVVDLASATNHASLSIAAVLDLNDPKVDPANILGEC